MKSARETVSIEELLASLPEKYSQNDRELIQRAYQAALEAHRGQTRHSGDPYVTHCVAVAKILADLKMSPQVVAAGLLHDTVEDTSMTLEDLKRDFGETVMELVDGVTKLTHLPRVSRGDQHANLNSNGAGGEAEESAFAPALGRKSDVVAETLRKTFIAMGKDVRVMFIKLADRLHNMRTLHYASPQKQKRVAEETLNIFAPVANRLGIGQLKWELEDLSLMYLNPEKYNEIKGKLTEKREERERQIEAIKKEVAQLLAENRIKAEVSGRPKHIYSIYRKMQKKGKTFEELSDIRAVRVLVGSEAKCYAALGVIHARWRPIPGEFDDYIAVPKNNMYQSLHTTVNYSDGLPLEIQIRTHEMHLKAEMGVAAHWRYKESDHKVDKGYETFISALRSMKDFDMEARNAAEFVESLRSDVFQDRIYVFTPRGDVIDLPAGSTPIDFAYHVHTDVGHRCRGAYVNGKMVPLGYELKTGDRVQILTASRNVGPSRDWLNSNLNMVRTNRALNKIREWFKKQGDSINLAQGREALEHELRRLSILESVNFEKLARSLTFANPGELFLAIGRGDLTINKVVREIVREEEQTQPTEEEEILKPGSATETDSTRAVQVVGLKNMLSTIAKCCRPMPGDQIIGYVTRGRGVSIHRRDCPNILQIKDRERLLKVTWGRAVNTYPAAIHIQAYDRFGLLNDVASLLSEENINITDVDVKTSKPNANIYMMIEVRDIAQLSRVLNRIERVPNVRFARRAKG